jgi:hypothetical protein
MFVSGRKGGTFDRSPYVDQTNAASTSQIAPKSASDNNTTTISGAVRLILIGRKKRPMSASIPSLIASPPFFGLQESQ